MKRLLVLISALGIQAASFAAGRPSPDAVRSDLREILSQPEYNRSFVSPSEDVTSWIAKIMDWITKQFGKLFGVSGFGQAGKIASILFACLVVGAFLFLLALVIRRLMGITPGDGEEEAPQSVYDLPSARPLISEARKLAESGDYRGAFKCAYLASISHLDEVKALRFERSRTNWEYLRELQGGGHDLPYSQLKPLTLDFDRKFYGREDCTRQDFENALAAYGLIAAESTQSAVLI